MTTSTQSEKIVAKSAAIGNTSIKNSGKCPIYEYHYSFCKLLFFQAPWDKLIIPPFWCPVKGNQGAVSISTGISSAQRLWAFA